jgi:hypothetical protein
MRRVRSYRDLSTPANVFVDAAADRYLVSNVAGGLTAMDGNGFISVLSTTAEGTSTPRWIAGGQNGVTLDAPKGLVVANGLLYVADIDKVRTFDAGSGAPRGDIRIPGAVYLAGMAVAPDGRVLVADAGVKVEKDGKLRTATDGAIWSVGAAGAAPAKLPTHESLGGPAALVALPDGGVLVATLASGTVYTLDRAGKKHDERKAPRGKLDGVALIDDKVYVSSWDAAAVYRRLESGTYAVQLAELRAPGGVAIDASRRMLLVPLMTEDRVDAFLVQ